MRALLVPLLLLSILSPLSRAAEFEGQRLARFVSRDARMLLWVGDRAAFMRRVERTDVVRLLGSSGARHARDAVAVLGAQASLFFSPGALGAIPGLLSRGTGEMAVSVEGYVLEGGEPQPDVLVLADVDGYEGMIDALANATTPAGRARLAESGFPIVLAERATPRVRTYRDARIVTVATRWGTISLAELDGVIFGARNESRIERALERARAGLFGSLADSAAFVETFEQVAPAPGSMFGFINLRQVRSERSIELVEADPIWDALLSDKDSFDAAGFAVRGVSGEFRANVFLRGGVRGRTVDASGRRERPLRSLSLVDRSAAVTLAVHTSGRQAGALLASMNRRLGGAWSAEKLENTFVGLLGPAWADQLASRVGGELVLFQTPAPGQYPTLAFLLETADPNGVRQWFEQTTEQVGSRPLRAFDAGGRRIYVMSLAGNQFLSNLAMTVFDGWLVGSTSVPVLRSLVDRMATSSSPLAESEAFLAPMDLLDRAAREPVYAILHADTERLVSIVQFWNLWGAGGPRQGGGDEAHRAAVELVSLGSDPEFADAARGIAIVAESRAGGLFLEIVGP